MGVLEISENTNSSNMVNVGGMIHMLTELLNEECDIWSFVEQVYELPNKSAVTSWILKRHTFIDL